MTSRDNIISFKVNEHEKIYAEKLAEKLDVSVSEAMRILLFDSRFLYSDDIDFTDINVPAEYVFSESNSSTTVEDAEKRLSSDT